ncbi:MAG: hypothetical protein R3C56_01265 [Pirellulaceae bacterium]
MYAPGGYDLGDSHSHESPHFEKITPLRLAFISALLTTPFHLLLVAAELPVALPQAMQPTILMAIIYSGVFSTGVAYVTWHVGVRRCLTYFGLPEYSDLGDCRRWLDCAQGAAIAY